MIAGPCPHCGWKPPTDREKRIVEIIQRMEVELRQREVVPDWDGGYPDAVFAAFLKIGIERLRTKRSDGEIQGGRRFGKSWFYTVEEMAAHIVDSTA